MTSSAQPIADDPRFYLGMAFQYYVCGRFAALNNFRIAPNLMHHAIELLAKFRVLKAARFQNEHYGHNLEKLWIDFKTEVGVSTLDRLDSVVAKLDRWEGIRYGGYPEGTPTTLLFMPEWQEGYASSIDPEDLYVFVLEEIDDLFSQMILVSRINPVLLGKMHGMPGVIPEWYAKGNLHPLQDLFPPPAAQDGGEGEECT